MPQKIEDAFKNFKENLSPTRMEILSKSLDKRKYTKKFLPNSDLVKLMKQDKDKVNYIFLVA